MTGMASTPKSDVAQAISDLHRAEWRHIVAILIWLVGDYGHD
jgi:RNA polymerase sigma-70 factor, ECF subfamily